MKITEEMVAIAAVQLQETYWGDGGMSMLHSMRAALQAVLPEIEREIREECAELVEGYASDCRKGKHGLLRHVAEKIRSFPPSTQDLG